MVVIQRGDRFTVANRKTNYLVNSQYLCLHMIIYKCIHYSVTVNSKLQTLTFKLNTASHTNSPLESDVYQPCRFSFCTISLHSPCRNCRCSATILCWHSLVTLSYELGCRNRRLRRFSSSSRWITYTPKENMALRFWKPYHHGMVRFGLLKQLCPYKFSQTTKHLTGGKKGVEVAAQQEFLQLLPLQSHLKNNRTMLYFPIYFTYPSSIQTCISSIRYNTPDISCQHDQYYNAKKHFFLSCNKIVCSFR